MKEADDIKHGGVLISGMAKPSPQRSSGHGGSCVAAHIEGDCTHAIYIKKEMHKGLMRMTLCVAIFHPKSVKFLYVRGMDTCLTASSLGTESAKYMVLHSLCHQAWESAWF